MNNVTTATKIFSIVQFVARRIEGSPNLYINIINERFALYKIQFKYNNQSFLAADDGNK